MAKHFGLTGNKPDISSAKRRRKMKRRLMQIVAIDLVLVFIGGCGSSIVTPTPAEVIVPTLHPVQLTPPTHQQIPTTATPTASIKQLNVQTVLDLEDKCGQGGFSRYGAKITENGILGPEVYSGEGVTIEVDPALESDQWRMFLKDPQSKLTYVELLTPEWQKGVQTVYATFRSGKSIRLIWTLCVDDFGGPFGLGKGRDPQDQWFYYKLEEIDPSLLPESQR